MGKCPVAPIGTGDGPVAGSITVPALETPVEIPGRHVALLLRSESANCGFLLPADGDYHSFQTGGSSTFNGSFDGSVLIVRWYTYMPQPPDMVLLFAAI